MGTVTTGRVVRSFVPADMSRHGARPAAPAAGAASPAGAGANLADLVSRAEAQVVVLRRLLEDSALIDEGARLQNGRLGESLEAGVRVIEQIDTRLEKARDAGAVLEKARTLLDGLTGLIEQISKSRADVEQFIARRAGEQRARIEDVLKETDAALDVRIASWHERADAAAAEFDAAATAAKANAEDSIRGLENALREDAERLSRLIDERAKQVQARLDAAMAEADQRLAAVRAEAERLSEAGLGRAQAICDRAAALVGIGPDGREPDEATEAPAGSLRHAIGTGEALLRRVDDAVLRLAVVADTGDQIRESVQKAALEGEALAAEHARRVEQMQEAIIEGARAAGEVERALSRTRQETEDARARGDAAAAALRGFAEVAEALRTGADQQLERVREAEASLRAMVERAEAAAATVGRCLEQVTAQAGDLVALAKEVGELVQRAEAIRSPQVVNPVLAEGPGIRSAAA